MSRLARSAYGLDSGFDGISWRRRGACSTGQYDPNLWTSPSVPDQAQAIWVCRRECTVTATCLEWAAANTDQVDQCVYGGLYWSRGANGPVPRPVRPARQQPKPRPPTGYPARDEVVMAPRVRCRAGRS